MWTPDDWTRSSIIIIGCTLAWLLAPGPTGAETRVDLQVLVWSLPHQSDVEMDLVLTEFEEERGLVIDLVRAPDPDTYLDFLDDLRTTGDMPDLLLVDPGLAVDLDDERALAALDLHFAHPDDLPVAAEELLVEYTLDGFIYGVPVAADGEQHAAAYAISVDAVDHGRGELAFELLERLADALPAVEDDGFRNPRSIDVEDPVDDEHAEIARILTPVTLYYVERYFEGMEDRTELDDEIEAILGDSAEGQDLLAAALQAYQELDDEILLQSFDPEAVMLISDNGSWGNLDLGSLADRVAALQATVAGATVPAAPSDLVATNRAGGPDTVGQDRHKIELTWTDNATDEDGFLIYRRDPRIPGRALQQVGSVAAGVTSTMDYLSAPSAVDDQLCYQVVAYTVSPIHAVGQSAVDLESDPSNTACAYYTAGYPQPLPLADTDGDGLPDAYDDCPHDHAGKALATAGCPDGDGDGVADRDDLCPSEWGEVIDGTDTGPHPQAGCPLEYTLRWMGMTVLNNSAPYAHPQYAYTSAAGNPIPDEGADGFAGEEPYLHFRLTNGLCNLGAPQTVSDRWCCGDGVDVASGNDHEPDADSTGEQYPGDLADLRAHGLSILPGIGGAGAVPIDRELGLLMNITLMERDYSPTLTIDQSIAGLETAIKVSAAVATAFSGCVSSGGVTCMRSVGKAVQSTITSFLGLYHSLPPISAQDPDDLMGSEVWTSSRYEAMVNTSDDGAYGFHFTMPVQYEAACLGWAPCSLGWTVPVPIRARIEMCLVRDGVAESQVQGLCAPYVLGAI